MKRSITLVFLLAVLLAPFTADAKDTKFNLFVVGAFHNNTFETTTIASGATVELEDDATLGFGGGLSAEFMMDKGMSFELGVAYIQRKSETTVTVLGVSLTAEATINVIEIPAIMHFYLGEAVSFGIGAYAGIADNDADTAETEFGATASLRFHLGQMIFLGGRYNYPITDIIDTASTQTEVTAKSQGFYILGGITF